MLASFARRIRLGIAFAVGLGGVAASGMAAAAAAHPVELWTIEPNEGRSAGGHSAIRIGETIYHVEHRGDGMLADRRDTRVDFERVYRLEGNRSIDVLGLALPASVEEELEGLLRRRYFDRRQRLERLAELEEDLRWLERALDTGRLEVFVPGLGLLAPGPAGCTGEGGRVRAARRARIVERFGSGWLEARIRLAREELHRAIRAATGARRTVGGEARDESEPARGRMRGVVEAAQTLVALEAIRDCRAPATDRLVALFPDAASANGEETRWPLVPADTWAGIEAELESDLLRLLASDRSDPGLAILLAWCRLVGLDRTRETGIPHVIDPLAETSGRRRGAAAAVPVGWRAARSIEARRKLEHRVQELVSSDAGVLEQKLFRVETARHFLAHAQADELHTNLASDAALRVTAAARYPGATIDLPWPDGGAIGHLEARRGALAAAAGRERGRLRADLGYVLFTRNCVTELFDAFDAVLSRHPHTESFGRDRARDPESAFAFIPVVAGRIARRHLPVTEVRRLSSWRESALRSPSGDGVSRLAAAIRESNTLSSRTYRPHPGDSAFLLFSQQPIWARPIAGIANLATGLGAMALGVLHAPFDRGEVARRGLQGVVMSVPELFFFSIRKGSYVVAPPFDAGYEAPRDFGAGGA